YDHRHRYGGEVTEPSLSHNPPRRFMRSRGKPGSAMNSRIIVSICLLMELIGGAGAQQSSDRIDLDAIATQSPFPGLPNFRLAAAHIAFTESEVICPERHGSLQISAGALRLYRLL